MNYVRIQSDKRELLTFLRRIDNRYQIQPISQIQFSNRTHLKVKFL